MSNPFTVVPLVLLLSIYTSGCMKVGVTTDIITDPKKELAALLETDRKAAQISAENGLHAAYEYLLADDAISLPFGENPVYGKGNILAIMSETEGLYSLEWEPVEGEVAASGELGWTWGNGVVKVLDGEGSIRVIHSKYLNVWKKNEAGEWKLRVDIGNPSPTPEILAPNTEELLDD